MTYSPHSENLKNDAHNEDLKNVNKIFLMTRISPADVKTEALDFLGKIKIRECRYVCVKKTEEIACIEYYIISL